MSTDTKKRIITLTGRAPVAIVEDAWPVIASDRGWTGQHECQANEEWLIRVRQHADGRAIVYVVRDSGPGGMAIGYSGSRGGALLSAGSDLAAAIRSVGEHCGIPEAEIAGCIADLPAEEL